MTANGLYVCNARKASKSDVADCRRQRSSQLFSCLAGQHADRQVDQDAEQRGRLRRRGGSSRVSYAQTVSPSPATTPQTIGMPTSSNEVESGCRIPAEEQGKRTGMPASWTRTQRGQADQRLGEEHPSRTERAT